MAGRTSRQTSTERTQRAAFVSLALRLCLMAVLFCGTLPAVSAEEAPIEAAPVPRRVLALHDDATQGPDADFEHLITQMAEMPLNHLGYVVSAWPISRGRPPAAWGHERVAVLTWFTKDGPRPDWLLPWLEAQRAQGP